MLEKYKHKTMKHIKLFEEFVKESHSVNSSLNERLNIKKLEKWKPKPGTFAEQLFKILLRIADGEQIDDDETDAMRMAASAGAKNPKKIANVLDELMRTENSYQDYEEDSDDYDLMDDAQEEWDDAYYYAVSMIADLKE
jgi:hypothetical protein